MNEKDTLMGASCTSRLVVRAEDTAQCMGSGDLPVLATPRLVALMENAAMNAVARKLDPALTTVGGEMRVRHLAPSPIGSSVEATALVVDIQGRKLTFHVTAHEGGKLIGEGEHTRFVVDREKFLAKL